MFVWPREVRSYNDQTVVVYLLLSGFHVGTDIPQNGKLVWKIGHAGDSEEKL